MEYAINTILNGVELVPKCGNPGSLVLFEPSAFPILTGDSVTDIVFAAAEVGHGRVFVTTHELYVEYFLNHSTEFGKLWSNIRSWLGNTRYIRNDEIRSIEEFDSVMDIPSDTKLIKWIGTHHKTDLFINQLLKKYLQNGGSLICAICPWGWLSVSHGKTLEEMSLNKFLSLIGICFTPELCSVTSKYFHVKHNLALESHFGNSIDILADDMKQCVRLERLLCNGIAWLPSEIATKHLEKIHKILYSYICSKYKPTSKTSVSCPIGRCLLTICSKIYQKFSSCGIRVKAPNIEEFPGSFNNLCHPETKIQVIAIKSKFDEFHCTGCYIAAGSLIRCCVLEGNPSGWQIRVGSHTDDLSTMSSLKRWPLTYSTIKLKKNVNITSAFGGIIYLESPKGSSSIKVKLENVIESPYFDLNKPATISQWLANSQSPGLWAEICGKHISFTVPSSSIRNLKDPSEALRLWDQFIISNHELRGTDPLNTWRERVVVDIQPYGNQIHSGYPVTISYDYVKQNSYHNLFDAKYILTNGWNVVHELAHNMQRSCWTPNGTEEVTVNIFTLHGFNSVFNQDPWLNRVLKQKLDEKLLDILHSKTYSTNDFFKNPYIGLFMYAQLINAFGWTPFKVIFREYESLNDKEKLFKTDTDKWDQWICRFSNVVGLDVSPLFYFWSIPFSEKPGTNLTDLTPWLPDDEITRSFPDRVKYVRKNYNGLLVGNEENFINFPKIIYSC